MQMDYDVIIGFETHVELDTESKLFCSCPTAFGAPPNSQICPVCTGQPGALPVLNRKAVEFTVRAGLAMNCDINRLSRFARKNYFYPDLPKGYQISQYERPFCENGYLAIPHESGHTRNIGIKRIHLEEDAGKLMHGSETSGGSPHSLIDYNRCSVPLLEIVTDHARDPITSPREARIYLEHLRQTIRHIGISECIIERGQFRCDVNVSLRPRGSESFGNRTEIKNMASFRFIMEALDYEVNRQREVLQGGSEIVQETRLFDEDKRITIPMRSKEDAPDYRYFPDPDLMEVEIDQEFLNRIQTDLPELPDRKVRRFARVYGISGEDGSALTRDPRVAEFFEQGAGRCADPRQLSSWITKDLLRLLSDAGMGIESCPFQGRDLARLVDLVQEGKITRKSGRVILQEMIQTGEGPEQIMEDKGLAAIEDAQLLERIVDETLAENPGAADQVRSGMTKPLDFLMGKVMAKSHGRANPKTVRSLLRGKLLGS